MLTIIAILCLLGALVILLILSAIDLKVGLLPNEFVLGLLALGLVFHLSTLYKYLTMTEMALGGFIGAAVLYVIRGLADKFYQEDSLGLGDVKLMGAAGIWLGPYFILIALTAGALAGLVHGLGLAFYWKIKTKGPLHLSSLSLPAGPGFAVGILIAAIYAFRDLPAMVFQ